MLVSGQSRRWIVNAEHRLILDAIERRDPTDAGRYLSGHIRRTRTELDRHPEIFEFRRLTHPSLTSDARALHAGAAMRRRRRADHGGVAFLDP